MNGCSNLIYLSTVACKLSECLTEEELSVLSADLVVLSDMLANILTRRNACEAKHKARMKKQKESADEKTNFTIHL